MACFFDDFGYKFLEFCPFSRGNPRKMDALRVDAEREQQFPKEYPTPSCVKIAAGVMAIARMATADQHGISTGFQGLEHEVKINPSGAGQPDNPQVCRIFQSARSR